MNSWQIFKTFKFNYIHILAIKKGKDYNNNYNNTI